MGLSVVNEKELGASIAENVAPKLAELQARLEVWAEGLLTRVLEGHRLRLTIPLGDRAIAVMVELVPKP